MKKSVVLVGGLAKSGKGEVANILVEHLGFTERSFADPLRAMAEAINPIVDWGPKGPLRYGNLVNAIGYRETKDLYPEARGFLQRLGTEAIREVLGPDVWVNHMVDHLPDGFTVIPDVRFHNELELGRKDGVETISVWIDRPGIKHLNGHASENTLQPELFEHRISNDGELAELTPKVLEWAKQVGLTVSVNA